jgi:NADH-quinone oxidoreductase subunit M
VEIQTTQSAPWEALVVCLLLLLAPAVASPRLSPLWRVSGLTLAVVTALFVSSGPMAYLAIAAGALLHAMSAGRRSVTGAVVLTISAALSVAAAAAIAQDALTAAFVLSCLAIALRAGILPLHIGAASLCERVPLVQTEQLSSMIALVFVHLRFVDHHTGAAELGPWLVRYGALAAISAALLAIVQRDLRGFYRSTTAMHGGMLIAALGTAALGNFAAALLVAVSMGLALGGLGMMITSLEERVGPVVFAGPGGRGTVFPRLAILFAIFGGAGVGMPGTSSFVADDVLLHTLWMASPAATIVVILSSAVLAVATLVTLSRVFLGRTTPSLAPDLGLRERLVAVSLVALLITLGIVPDVLLGPADAFLSGPPPPQ